MAIGKAGSSTSRVDPLNVKYYGDALSAYNQGYGQYMDMQGVVLPKAKAVMEYLIEKGVPSERMISKGYGEDSKFFIGDNATEEGRQKNRRVEVIPVQK